MLFTVITGMFTRIYCFNVRVHWNALFRITEIYCLVRVQLVIRIPSYPIGKLIELTKITGCIGLFVLHPTAG